MAYAYCYASGEIEIGARVPDGAVAVGKGRRRDVERAVQAAARHGYDGVTLLVPGVPEARDQNEGIQAAMRFRDQVRQRLDRYRAEDRNAGR